MSLVMCVWPVAISGYTSDPGIHKLSGSEEYMKGLLEWEECKMFVEFHSHSLVTLIKQPHSVTMASYKSSDIFHLILFVLQLYYRPVYGVEDILFWKHFYLNLGFWCTNDTVYFFNTQKWSSFPEPLFKHYCVFAVVFSTQTWLRKSLQHLTHKVSMASCCASHKDFVYLPAMPSFDSSPNPITCIFAVWCVFISKSLW